MINTKEYILDLSMPEKVSLFNELYSELSGYGTDGDTELAHVNTFEVGLLKSVGGSGTINEITELQQFGGGGQPPPPANQSVTQTTEFPPELRPFISDILGEAQAEFNREKQEGFLPFPGPQIAAFTPEQQAAFETGRGQFTGLAGTPLAAGETYARPALAATALGTSEIGAQDIGRRMDPFIQNVVDIAKREATRDEEAAVQGRAAQAVGAGSFGGTRQALVESEAERNLGERLGDIQARGLSTAFQNAQQAAEAQRGRELAGGRQFAALGDAAGQRARSDIGGLAGIGETQQQRGQQALDIARQEFGQEQVFPAQTLGKYQSIVRGFPYQMGFTQQSQQTVPTPSLAQTLTGGAATAAGLYGMFGGFGGGAGKQEGGMVGRQGGGLVSLEDGGAVERLGGGLFKRSGTAQPQAGASPSGRGLSPEIMELLRRHAQENRGETVNVGPIGSPQFVKHTGYNAARNEGGLIALQGGGVPTAPTTGGVPQVPLGAQKMVPHLMKMYESNPQFKNKIDRDVQQMVPNVQGVNLGAGGAQTNLGMAGAPPYVPVRSGGGLVSLAGGTEDTTVEGSSRDRLLDYLTRRQDQESQSAADLAEITGRVKTSLGELPTREERLERADKRRMQALYASLIAGGAGIMGADPQKGYAAAVGEGFKTGLPIAASGMEGYYDALDEADKTEVTNLLQEYSLARDAAKDEESRTALDLQLATLLESLHEPMGAIDMTEGATYLTHQLGYKPSDTGGDEARTLGNILTTARQNTRDIIRDMPRQPGAEGIQEIFEGEIKKIYEGGGEPKVVINPNTPVDLATAIEGTAAQADQNFPEDGEEVPPEVPPPDLSVQLTELDKQIAALSTGRVRGPSMEKNRLIAEREELYQQTPEGKALRKKELQDEIEELTKQIELGGGRLNKSQAHRKRLERLVAELENME